MAKPKQERGIDETLNDLTELITMQEKALRTADTLLGLKDCIIQILEEQKKINERHIKVLKICLYSLVALYSIVFIASYFAK
jgi:hypothetical protein